MQTDCSIAIRKQRTCKSRVYNYYDFRFVLNYQDHFTKFCLLKPLTSKRATAIAAELVNIFTIFGAPRILQSDNGREFVGCVIEELKVMWPDLTIVHGKPRHPQSQGSVERANGDVEDMLRAWLNDNNTTRWSLGLQFVQLQKNTAENRTLQMSPYRALFGQDPSVGLKSDFPRDVLLAARPETEEDLARLVNSVPQHDHQAPSQDQASISETEQSDILSTEPPQQEMLFNTIVSDEEEHTDGRLLTDESIPFCKETGNATALDVSITARSPQSPRDERSPQTALAVLESLSQPDNRPDANNQSTDSDNSSEDALTILTSLVTSVDCATPSCNEDEESVSSLICAVCEKLLEEPVTCHTCLRLFHRSCVHDDEEEHTQKCFLCDRISRQKDIREQVNTNQKRSATSMLESARKKLKVAGLNDSVRVPIPLVDRAKTDHRNLLGLIVAVDESGLFQIRTKVGLLASKFARNQFELCEHRLLTTDDIPAETKDTVISVRQAAIACSQSHGQGYMKCSCNGDCKTNRCKCRKHRLLCNSHCHTRNNRCKNHC